MATYGQMQARIATELARVDLTSDIQDAILSAVQHYSGRKFWFNEAVEAATTVQGDDTLDWPLDFVEPDSILITVDGKTYPLKLISYAQLNGMDSGAVIGTPQYVASYRQEFRFYPIPNAAYPITLSYTQKLADLTSSSDSNAWTTEGEELIRTHAKKVLFAGKIANYDAAMAMQKLEMEILDSLTAETERRVATGDIRTWW